MASLPGGDIDRNVTITFIGRDNASRAMNSITSSTSRAQRVTQALTKALKFAAVAAAAALAAAAAFLAYQLFQAVKAAYADDIAMKQLARTQRKAQDATVAQTEATSDFIDRMELLTGIADDELRPALSALALTGMSVKQSQDLLNVAMDVSVAKHKSLQSVAEALAKGYNGTTTSLAKMGVKVTDASGQALSFGEILKTLKDRTKGAAEQAGRLDPWSRLSAAFHQIQEQIGRKFLPLFRRLGNYIITKVVPWVKEHLVPAFGKFARWLKEELPKAWANAKRIFDNIWGILQSITRIVLEANKVFLTLAGIFFDFGDDKKGHASILGFLSALDALLKIVSTDARLMGAAFDTFASAVERAGDAARNSFSAIHDITTVVTGGGPLGWLTRASGGYIPGRASGGMVKVGEHGPELLNPRTGWMLPASRSHGGGGPTVVVNINHPIDAAGSGRAVQKVLDKYARVGGRSALAPA